MGILLHKARFRGWFLGKSEQNIVPYSRHHNLSGLTLDSKFRDGSSPPPCALLVGCTWGAEKIGYAPALGIEFEVADFNHSLPWSAK